MPNLFEHSSGTPVELAGNRPLFAVDECAFWVVTSGEADVFAVPKREGKTVGNRTHLFRGWEGDLILGGIHHDTAHDLEFMVTGRPGTVLTRFDRSVLDQALVSKESSKAVFAALSQWVARLSHTMGQGPPCTDKYLDLEAGTTVLAGPKEIIRTNANMIWIRPIAGNVFPAEDEGHSPLAHQEIFPLNRALWLKAQDFAHVSAFSNEDMVQRQAVSKALDYFHERFFLALRAIEKQKQTEDRTAYDRRMTSDQQRLENAFTRLGAMLFQKKRAETSWTPSHPPLVSAAIEVARACGIETERLSKGFSQNQTDLQPEDIARAGNFFIRRIHLTPGWSREDNGSLLGRLTDEAGDRFVALLSKSPKRYELLDPLTGTRMPVTPDLEREIHTSAWSFYRPLPSKSLTIRDVIKFTLTGVWRDLGTILLVGVAGALLALLIPIMTGEIIDSVIPEANHRELLQIGLILLVSVFATFMFQMTRAIATVRMEGRMDSGLQAAVMDRLLSLPSPFFRRYTAGDLANRTLGINRIRQILSGATLTTAMTAVFSSFNMIVMFVYDWQLALIGMGMILITLTLSGALSIAMVRYQRNIFDIQGKNAGLVLQLLTGIAKLRVTGTENRAFGVWADSFSQKKAIDFKSGKLNAALDTITSFLPMISTLLIFWFFMRFRTSGLSTGHFLAFSAAFSTFQAALVQSTLTFAGLLHVIPLWERSKPILTARPEVTEAKMPVSNIRGNVTVDHVSFRYREDGPHILKDVSLTVSSGEFIALVGGSGAGKSTLLRVLLGFETPETGSVSYDGRDLSEIDVKSVRRHMGVVLQNGQVMPGSILKNITGATNLTIEDAWRAARMVGLDEDITAMPMGMHTVVSPGGGTLSGGQRQRLIVARAVVRRPRLLIFDEATSALDNRTQALVSESIEKMNVTRIVIAHRLSTIMHADRIYVMAHGEIRESGTYSKLMEKKGAFYQLAKRQIA